MLQETNDLMQPLDTPCCWAYRGYVRSSVDTSDRVHPDDWPVIWLDPTMLAGVEQTHDNKRVSLLLLDVFFFKCSCLNGNIGSANSDT